MRVLITGAKGQVGQHLVKNFSQEVTLLALGKEDLDVTNEDEVIKCVHEFKPDFVINSSAYTNVEEAEVNKDICYLINKMGAKYLASASATCGATIIHISTDYVFSGDTDNQSYLECDFAGPINTYGKSKLEGECEVIANNHRHIILRTAWLFSSFSNNFVTTMLRLGQSRKELGIVADQLGGPTDADDVANVIIAIICKLYMSNERKYGVYHYSGYPYVSWYDFADKIFDIAHKKNLLIKPYLKKMTTSQYITNVKRPYNTRLNCSKIKRDYNIDPCNWASKLEMLLDREILNENHIYKNTRR
ncbi:dTDP-4-dehydrorhamnose reductase [Vibrio rotiferianus]|uniref:dTDP-4-dehydrorhamnose reductase n=1 Tax=Vibrio rotiferianus TaxID=190895 RepID=UPI0039099E94